MEEVDVWMKRAEEDLRVARILLENSAFADSVYHAQQAAEKAAKALLMLMNVEVMEHKVGGIFYDSVAIHYPELEEVSDAIVRLEKHWVKPRYPIKTSRGIFDPLKYYNRDIAKKAIKDAEFVVKRIKEFIEKEFGIKVKQTS